jgi:hypothetical protein
LVILVDLILVKILSPHLSLHESVFILVTLFGFFSGIVPNINLNRNTLSFFIGYTVGVVVLVVGVTTGATGVVVVGALTTVATALTVLVPWPRTSSTNVTA